MRLKLGIRGHDLPGAPFETIDDFVDSFRQFDLDYLQLVYKKAFRNFAVDPRFLLELSDKLKENRIRVAMVGAYFNMIHPDEEKYLDGVEFFKQCLETAPVFDCGLVGSETGSANGDRWTYNEYNHTKQAYERVADTIRGLVYYGNSFKTRPVIEGAYAHTVYEPDLLYELCCDTGIQDVTIDIYNYLHIGNYEQADAIFERSMELFKDKVRIFHIKDFKVEQGKLVQCGIGQGIMNWKKYIPVIMSETPDAVCILEGVTGDDIETSIAYLRRLENGSED